MGKFAAITIILTMCNLFLYPFLYLEPFSVSDAARTQVEDDLGMFVNIDGNSAGFNNSDAKEALPGSIDQNSIESGTGLSYVSGLTTIWNFIVVPLGIVGNIYFLMLKFGIPWIIALFVGLPTIMLQVFSFVAVIRGYDV